MLRILDVSASGMIAQRERMNVIAGNIANVNTTRDADGNANPYQRRFIEFFSQKSGGNDTGKVGFRVHTDTQAPPRVVSKPGHKDADAEGNVRFPNVNVINEFADAVLASRAYEANIAAVQMTRQMADQTLQLLQ